MIKTIKEISIFSNSHGGWGYWTQFLKSTAK